MGSYHDLVADRIACGEKRYTVFLGECLDQLVFTEIGFAFQLNLMVNREDRLRRVFDSRGIHRHKFLGDRPGVVVTETPMRSYLNIVAATNELAFRQTNGVALDDLLGESLRCLDFVRAVAKAGASVYFVRRKSCSTNSCSGQ